MSEIISPYNPKIKTVNIKEDFPPCDVAVFNLYKAIFENERMGFEVLKIVHGYGSHGKGGEIKKAVKDYLTEAQRKKEIQFFVCGENWSSKNEKVKYLESKYPELILDEDIKNINSGITVILLNLKK